VAFRTETEADACRSTKDATVAQWKQLKKRNGNAVTLQLEVGKQGCDSDRL
jgi:hypothetical protein